MEPIIIGFVREEMMNVLLLWRRSLQKRLNPGVNNFMQKRVFLIQMRKKRALFMGLSYFRYMIK